jgi:hypothetical protein
LGGTIEIVNEKGYRGLRVKQHAASSTRNGAPSGPSPVFRTSSTLRVVTHSELGRDALATIAEVSRLNVSPFSGLCGPHSVTLSLKSGGANLPMFRLGFGAPYISPYR